MVKDWTLLESIQKFKLKSSVGFDQNFSIEIKKKNTIYCVPFFSLQTSDKLRYPITIEREKDLITCKKTRYLTVPNPCNTINVPGSNIENYYVPLIIPLPLYVV
jgi:hypothetical protein